MIANYPHTKYLQVEYWCDSKAEVMKKVHFVNATSSGNTALMDAHID